MISKIMLLTVFHLFLQLSFAVEANAFANRDDTSSRLIPEASLSIAEQHRRRYLAADNNALSFDVTPCHGTSRGDIHDALESFFTDGLFSSSDPPKVEILVNLDDSAVSPQSNFEDRVKNHLKLKVKNCNWIIDEVENLFSEMLPSPSRNLRTLSRSFPFDMFGIEAKESTGGCPSGLALTESECEHLADGFGSQYGGSGYWGLPETCGCYIDQNGKRYFNRPQSRACNRPDPKELMICHVPSYDTFHSSAPDSIDFRGEINGGVRDQGQFGTCAAFAAATVKAYHERKEYGSTSIFSPRYIYAFRRHFPGEGMFVDDLGDILEAHGALEEVDMPYNRMRNDQNAEEFSEALKEKGRHHRISRDIIIRFDERFDTVATFKAKFKRNMMQFGVGIIGVSVYNNDNDCEMWNRQGNEGIRGGHAMATVGYDANGIIIQNSWGDDYCEGGYTTMKWEDVEKAKYFAFYEDVRIGRKMTGHCDGYTHYERYGNCKGNGNCKSHKIETLLSCMRLCRDDTECTAYAYGKPSWRSGAETCVLYHGCIEDPGTTMWGLQYYMTSSVGRKMTGHCSAFKDYERHGNCDGNQRGNDKCVSDEVQTWIGCMRLCRDNPDCTAYAYGKPSYRTGPKTCVLYHGCVEVPNSGMWGLQYYMTSSAGRKMTGHCTDYSDYERYGNCNGNGNCMSDRTLTLGGCVRLCHSDVRCTAYAYGNPSWRNGPETCVLYHGCTEVPGTTMWGLQYYMISSAE